MILEGLTLGQKEVQIVKVLTESSKQCSVLSMNLFSISKLFDMFFFFYMFLFPFWKETTKYVSNPSFTWTIHKALNQCAGQHSKQPPP